MAQQKINILHWNANGISNKIYEFYDIMEQNYIHVACLSETFLKPHIKLPSHPDFVTHRFDRTEKTKGGVAIIIRRNLKHTLLPYKALKLFETVGVEINLECGSKIHITSVYMPGGSRHTPVKDHFGNDIRLLTSSTSSYFICGDFNALHRHWNCHRANQAGNILYDEYSNNNFLIKYPPTHTRIPYNSLSNPSTIDLVLTNGLHSMSDPKCLPMTSDHNAVLFTISTNSKLERNTERFSFDFKNADWDKFRGIIHYHISTAQFNINSISNVNEIEQHIEKFLRLIKHARDRSIPTSFHHQYKLCIPDELKSTIKIKNSLRKMWQRTRCQMLKTTVNKMEKEIKREINIIRNDNWQTKLSNIKPSNQSVWSTARMLKNNKKFIPPLKDDDDKIYVSPQEKTELLAEQFVKNHQNPLASTNPQFTAKIEEEVNEYLNDSNVNYECSNYATEEELTDEIKKLKNKKAPGIDQINNQLIKKLPSRGIQYLLFIINACLKYSYFPDRYKTAKIIAILKSSKNPSFPSSYRPISLLCVISKLLERIILNRLNKHLDAHNIIPEEQHGFKKYFSTTHQLHKVIGNAKRKLKEKYSTGIVMLDVEKAFDRVWHAGLLHKMILLHFPPYLTKIISNFLKERKFFVALGGSKSTIYDMLFGVPQGAVLSPTLYNVYTYDIPKYPRTSMALFADDTAFYASSPIAKNIKEALVQHGKIISDYMNKWKIKMNVDKTQAIFITNRRKKELPGKILKIFNSKIAWQNESKYLGFMLDKKMSFKKHIQYVIDRANIAVQTLYPLISRKSKLHLKNKITIYKLAIRPILTYACPAFINISKYHIEKIQKFQNRILRMILNLNRFTRIHHLHTAASVPLVKDYVNKLSAKFQENLH